MASNYKYNFFLSYSHENKNEVMKMLDHLTIENLSVWKDTEEMRQGNIDEHMMNGIRSSEIFVACISIKYKDSKNSMKEFNYAVAIKKEIVYVLCEKIKGEEERMDKLGVIGFHIARKHFYKSENVEPIIKAIKDLLMSPKNKVEREQYCVNSELSSDIAFDPIENFLDKNTVNKIKEGLWIKQKVWIHGPPGIGKTTYASEFANTVKFTQIVRWFDARSKGRIENSFKKIFEELIGKTDDLEIEIILNLVFGRLNLLKNELLIVFDNVNNSNEIDKYLKPFKFKSNIKILITSRDTPKTFENDYNQIEIETFSKTDVEIYFENLFQKRFTKDQINLVIDRISFERQDKFLIQKVELIASFIRNNKLLGFEELLSVLSKNKNNFETIISKILIQLENEERLHSAFTILTFLKYFKSENIEIILIKDLIGSEHAEQSVDALINLGIAKMNYNNPDYPSIQLHALMKQEIQNYIQINKKEQSIDLFIDLIISSIPTVDSIPDKKWKMAAIYVPYVENILENTAMKTKQISLLWDAKYYYEINVRLNYNNALESIKQSLEIQESLNEVDQVKVGDLLHKMGLVKDYQGEYEASLDIYSKAIIVKKKVYGEDHPSVADTINNIGLVKATQGEYKAALDNYSKALRIYEKVNGEYHFSTADTINNMAIAKAKQGEYNTALVDYSKALQIYTNAYGENHIETADTINNIGLVKYYQDEYDEALENYFKALKIKQKVYGEDHPSISSTINNIGLVKSAQGEIDSAIDYYSKALKIKQNVYGDNHPSTADTIHNIATLKAQQGEKNAALYYYIKALIIKKKVYGDDHPSTADTINNIGLVKAKQGEYKAAVDNYSKALKIYEKVYGVGHLETTDTIINIGLVMYELSEYDAALDNYSKALLIKKKVYGEDHTSIASTINNIGLVKAKQEEYNSALDYYSKALIIYQKYYKENHPTIKMIKNNINNCQQSKERKS